MNTIPVTLESLGGGAATERFYLEMQRVMANIHDPNTDPKKTRSITLKVTIKPESNRESAAITISTSSTIAPVNEHPSRIFLGKDGNEFLAVEMATPEQQELFPKPQKISEKVVATIGAAVND